MHTCTHIPHLAIMIEDSIAEWYHPSMAELINFMSSLSASKGSFLDPQKHTVSANVIPDKHLNNDTTEGKGPERCKYRETGRKELRPSVRNRLPFTNADLTLGNEECRYVTRNGVLEFDRLALLLLSLEAPFASASQPKLTRQSLNPYNHYLLDTYAL